MFARSTNTTLSLERNVENKMVADKSPIKTRQYSATMNNILHSPKELKEPPKTQKKLDGMPTDNLFACIGKIKYLPRLNEEIDNCKGLYSGMKSNYYYIGLLCDMIEFSLTKLFVIMTIIMLSPTLVELTTVLSKKVKFFDEFICHQLDFIEAQLRNVNTGFIFKNGGVIDKLIKLTTLVTRVTFFFPRVTYRMICACWEVFFSEVMENIEIGTSILISPRVRRSGRNKNKTALLTASPQRKRKHEETVEGLPGYMVSLENYNEEEDPDFVPQSDDDTEVTSASENEVSEDENTEEELEEIVEEIEDVSGTESPMKNVAEQIPFIENIDHTKAIL